MLTDEYRSKILRILEEQPAISQRALARELGVSLGKANYCLQALVQKGLVKANNFKNSNNKKAYAYLLTRRGLSEKARATARFLERKLAEYEALRREIETLRREVGKLNPARPSIRDRRVRFALVGCGRIAKSHFAALENFHDRAELIAVCDPNAAALGEAVKRNGARGYGSLTALLAESEPDIVVLATPSGLHPEQTIQIAEAGRHVMTEKPMATRWSDGKRMVQACDNAGVRLFVVKQNRYNATLQLAKRALEQGRFGRIYMVTVNVFWTRPQSYFESAQWRGTWEFDGGAFMNQASHYVDLLDWMIGPVESVYAYTATLARAIEVEDTGVAAIRWRSGALGSVNVTMLTYPKNLEGSITIIGEKGTARIGGVAVNEIQHWEFAEPAPEDALAKSSSYAAPSVYGFGHPAYYDNVIKVLTGEAEPQTDGREGLRSLEILIAIYRSARDGTRIPLPLEY